MAIEILPGIVLPEDELSFRYGPSSGPGGQNVNKVETRVTVLLSFRDSGAFDQRQQGLIQERLRTRISRAGVLRVTSQKERTREANRQEALRRLAELLADALSEPEDRQATRIPRREKRRRREDKKRRARVKALRAPPRRDD